MEPKAKTGGTAGAVPVVEKGPKFEYGSHIEWLEGEVEYLRAECDVAATVLYNYRPHDPQLWQAMERLRRAARGIKPKPQVEGGRTHA